MIRIRMKDCLPLLVKEGNVGADPEEQKRNFYFEFNWTCQVYLEENNNDVCTNKMWPDFRMKINQRKK